MPAYIYPVGAGRKEWLRLIEAASKVKIVVIANPASGPGEERNLDYATIFSEASRHGVTLVGYVSTQYAARPWDEIKKDVDRWVQFYPQIRGFFFDQQPREGQHAALYARIRDYAQQKLRDPLVITNPGIACDATYLADAVSNVTCVFQNYEGFGQFELTAALKGYEPTRFAALPYNIADPEAMRALIKDAILKRIGYLYITDAKPPNQWNALPSYWEAEVERSVPPGLTGAGFDRIPHGKTETSRRPPPLRASPLSVTTVSRPWSQRWRSPRSVVFSLRQSHTPEASPHDRARLRRRRHQRKVMARDPHTAADARLVNIPGSGTDATATTS